MPPEFTDNTNNWPRRIYGMRDIDLQDIDKHLRRARQYLHDPNLTPDKRILGDVSLRFALPNRKVQLERANRRLEEDGRNG